MSDFFKDYFKDLRHDKNHHLGLGDVRLTIAQQEELIAENQRLREALGEILNAASASGNLNGYEALDFIEREALEALKKISA